MRKKRKSYLFETSLLLAGILLLTACGTEEKPQEDADYENVMQDTAQASTGTAYELPSQVSSGTTYELPSQAEPADIYVEPIENLPENFIRGVDISSILAQEESGVVYYNEAGEEQDVFETLAQNGVNYVRVRVWNDPYDADGNGYGGGNNDADAAAEIGKRAASYGMKLCVDFHYSDFWADPAKQQCPKAWEGMAIEEKSEALYQYTKESLHQIIEAGAQVGIVQIGNEINNGMSGEKDWTKKRQLLQAGSKAVREVAEETGQKMEIAIHFTDIHDKNGAYNNAQKLKDKEIDYDIFAVSYYPFWHGTMENMTGVLKTIADTYEKKVMVAENSYPYTVEDGDGSGNSISAEDILPEYAASVQGQANEIRDTCAALAAVGDAGIGYFYWEPAWIPVNVYEENAADAKQILEKNQEAWEAKGSGWASSYAGSYDARDAGIYYGGSSWDNQALFDFTGHPLASLKVFKYLHCGTIVEQRVESIPQVEISVPLETALVMPETAAVIFNDRSREELPVIWDEEAVAAVDTGIAGVYEIKGTFSFATLDTTLPADVIEALEQAEVSAVVTVNNINLLANSSFEEADTSMWVITGNGTDFQEKTSDAHSGDMALHFWSRDEISFTVEQEITGLEAGTYEFGLYLQGGDVGENAEMYIYADNGKEEIAAKTTVAGWANWQNPVIQEITVGEDGRLIVGAKISSAANGWGTLDDFYLYKK